MCNGAAVARPAMQMESSVECVGVVGKFPTVESSAIDRCFGKVVADAARVPSRVSVGQEALWACMCTGTRYIHVYIM
jgi:hypothetical protein